MQCRAILSQIAGGPPDEPTSRSTGCISDFNSNSSITFFCILSRLSLTSRFERKQARPTTGPDNRAGCCRKLGAEPVHYSQSTSKILLYSTRLLLLGYHTRTS